VNSGSLGPAEAAADVVEEEDKTQEEERPAPGEEKSGPFPPPKTGSENQKPGVDQGKVQVTQKVAVDGPPTQGRKHVVGHPEDHLGDKAHQLKVNVDQGGTAPETVGPGPDRLPGQEKAQGAPHRKPGQTGQDVEAGEPVQLAYIFAAEPPPAKTGLATVALAMGMEVHMLCTYGGVLRLVKGRTEELGEETPPEVRETLRQGLEKGTITPLSEIIEEARQMGLKLYACAAALGNLNVARGELIEAVTASTSGNQASAPPSQEAGKV